MVSLDPEEESKREKNLKDMEKFFSCDVSVKKAMMKMAPNDIDKYNEEYIMKYSDRIFEELKNIRFQMKQLTSIFDFSDEYKELIDKKLSDIEIDFANCGTNFDKLRKTYQKCISGMSSEIINESKEKLVGYSIFRDEALSSLTCNSKTVNEMLHVVHSYVTNNEKILENMPIVDKKQGSNPYALYTLYGVEDEIARQIFDEIDIKNSQLGITDIIAVKNKVLMMVRDSGHALTLEIDETTKNPLLSYFIPKVCNAEKVNQLKGVTKVDLEDSKAIFGSTVGIFELGEKGKQNIGKEVIQFVEKVPTDNDLVMDFENEKLINLDPVFSEKNENFQKANVIVQKEENLNTNNLPKKQNFFQKFFVQTRKKIIKIFNNNGNFNNVEENVNAEVKKEEKSWYINSAEKEEVNNRISKIVNKVKESEKNLVSEKTEEENDR